MTSERKGIEVPSYEIIIASSDDEIQQCFNLRVDVFHHEQKFPLDTEFDDKEGSSTHFLLRTTPSLKPIGTIRGYVLPGATDTYKLTRLAILKDYRKYGFGRKLVDALHTWAKSHARGDAYPMISPPAAEIASGDSKSRDVQTNSNHTGPHIDPSQSYPPRSTRQIRINCHSQIYAKGFYTKMGYVAEGEEFIEDGDPHQLMVLRISIPDSA